MRNALRIIIILLSITIAGCSEKGNIESAIKDIYGSNVSPKEEDTSMIYVLDYSSKRESQEKDAIGLKDKIDKTTNSLAEKVGTDMASKSDTNTSATSQDDCLSDFYKWETPTIRIAMVSRRCVPDKGNDITIVVTEK